MEPKKHWIRYAKIRDEYEEFDLLFKVEVTTDTPVWTQVYNDIDSYSDNTYKVNAMRVPGNVMVWRDHTEYIHAQFLKIPGIFSTPFLTTFKKKLSFRHTINKQSKKKIQRMALDNS